MNSTPQWTLGQTLECADSFLRQPRQQRLTRRAARIYSLSLFTFPYASAAQRILGFDPQKATKVISPHHSRS